MKSIIKALVFPISLFVVWSCTPVVYMPNVINTPVFTNANEVKASGAFGFNHIEALGALSITKNIGLTGNYVWGKRDYKEAGVVFFINRNGFTFETVGGFAKGGYKVDEWINGKSSIWATQELYRMNTSFSKYFIQPSLFYNWKRFSAGYTLKLNYLVYKDYFYNVDFYNRYSPATLYLVGNQYTDDPGREILIIEHALILKFKTKYIQPFIQIGGISPFLIKNGDQLQSNVNNPFLNFSRFGSFVNSGIQLSLSYDHFFKHKRIVE